MNKLVSFLRESKQVTVWLLIGGVALTIVLGLLKLWSPYTTILVGALTTVLWLALWLGNAYLGRWLDEKISWHKQPGWRFAAGITGMLVYSIGAVYLIVLFFRSVIGFDVSDDLSGMFFSTLTISTLISMFMTGRAFLFNWRNAAVDAERLKRESVKAQYESLRSQVNPHFLFNSLNALTNLVHQQPDEAVRFIKQLSDVYRYVLDTRDKELVAVEEELRFLNAYLFLQQIRFGNKLKLDVRRETLSGHVAPLALQLLVENAIKHNIIADDRPLAVHLFGDDEYLWVTNTLQRKSGMPENPGGIGLDNIRRRYSFLSSRPVVVREVAGNFEVGLPLIPS